MANIKLSGFTLAKGDHLTGDDAYEYKRLSDAAIAIVCDGVGSAEAGAEAAKRASGYLLKNLKNHPMSWSMEKTLRHFIENINTILYHESIDAYERPELVTTLAVAVIEGDRLYGANVGDSRIYLCRDHTMHQLSKDHSSDEKGMEHVLTAAIGMAEETEIHYFENTIREKDRILLCSDGLYNLFESDEELCKAMSAGASVLVKYASKKVNDDLPDDTTAVIMQADQIDQTCKLKALPLPIPETLTAGQKVDGYTLKRPLVQNARTWLATQKGVEYVIKFAPVEAKEDEKILDLFVKEAWNAKRLKAGFFPKAVIPRNRTLRYYVMEHLSGDELKSYLKNRLLSIDEGVTLAKFLLHTEQFLLKYDLVHADIKPENIIRAQRKGKTYFKMVDFGSITEIFSTASRAGTPSYLAPGRFHGESIDEGSEIFSIGVTLYESLTGKLPYGEIEPFQTPTFKKPKPPTRSNPKIPPWLESIILHAIEVDREKRYKNYSEMLYDLENPDKVKPYYDKSVPLIEREPVKVYKIAFILSFLLNIYLLILLME
jgi:serine/threonine protein phosphatase PrpC